MGCCALQSRFCQLYMGGGGGRPMPFLAHTLPGIQKMVAKQPRAQRRKLRRFAIVDSSLSEGVLFPREQPEKDATATPVRRGGTKKLGIGWCPHTLIWTLAGQFQTVPKLRELLAGKQAAATANVFCNNASSPHNSEAGWTAKMTHTDDRSRKKERGRKREREKKNGKEARKEVAAR